MDSIYINEAIFIGESYAFNGEDYSETGTYSANLTNQFGCDSIVILNLSVIDKEQISVSMHINDIEIYEGDTLKIDLDLINEIFSNPNNLLLTFNWFIDEIENPDWISTTFQDSILSMNFIPNQIDTGCYSLILAAKDPFGQEARDTIKICVISKYTGINTEAKNVLDVSMYPNPTKGEVTLDFKKLVLEEVELKVMDISGRQILIKNYKSGLSKIEFDLSEYGSGIYIVILQIKSWQSSRKLIVK
jgi:hypothetical protein